MKKFRVDTQSWSSQEFRNLEDALKEFERTKDLDMGDGVDYDSYVELVSSEDDFEDMDVIKRASIVEDEQMTKDIGTPRQNGCDYDFWAKWVEE